MKILHSTLILLIIAHGTALYASDGSQLKAECPAQGITVEANKELVFDSAEQYLEYAALKSNFKPDRSKAIKSVNKKLKEAGLAKEIQLARAMVIVKRVPEVLKKTVFKNLQTMWLCEQILKEDGHGHVRCLQNAPDDKLIAGYSTGCIKVWDLKINKCIKTIKAHLDTVDCLQLTSDNKLVVGSYDKTITVWDLNTYKFLKKTMIDNGHISCLKLPADNELIVGSSGDLRDWRPTITVWDLNTNKSSDSLSGHKKWVASLQLTPHEFISGSGDNTIKLWNRKTHQCVATLYGHEDAVTCLEVVPDNACLERSPRKLISGSWDHTIRVWDLATRRCTHIFKDDKGTVLALQLRGTNELISCNTLTGIKILNLDTNECTQTIDIPNVAYTLCLQLSADNKKFYAGDANGAINIYKSDVSIEENAYRQAERDSCDSRQKPDSAQKSACVIQ